MSDAFDPVTADAGAIDAAAALLTTASTSFHTGGTQTRRGVTLALTEWHGARTDEFSRAASGLQVELDGGRDAADRVASALRAYARAIRAAASEISELKRQYDTSQSTSTAQAGRAQPGSDQADRIFASAGRTQAGLEQRALGARAELATAARRCAAAVDAELDGLVPGGHRLSPDLVRRRVTHELGLSGITRVDASTAWSALTTPMQVGPGVPPGLDAQGTASWWSHLTPYEQALLEDTQFRQLQNRYGLPSPVLDLVNRRALAADLVSLAAIKKRLEAGGQTGTSQYALVCKELKNAQGVDTELRTHGPGYGPGSDNLGSAPVLLLHWEPGAFNGFGSAAIAYGNPDTATNTGVVVPGTTATVAGMSFDNDARALFTQMGANGSHDNAVVAWLGYPAPASLPEAAKDTWAEQGTQPLIDSLASLRIAHEMASGGPGHLTVIGHSYGSYEVGRALMHGAQADDAIFIGSPGVGVDNVAGLHMSGTHVWDGRAVDDPIAIADGRFTPDPETGNGPEDGGFGDQHFDVTGSHGHSQYYQGESLRNMAYIVSGQYGDVRTGPPPDLRASVPLAINELLREKFPAVKSFEDGAGHAISVTDKDLRKIPVFGPVLSDELHNDFKDLGEAGKVTLQVFGDEGKGVLKFGEDSVRTLDDLVHLRAGATMKDVVNVLKDPFVTGAHVLRDVGHGTVDIVKGGWHTATSVVSDLNPFD